MAPIDGQPYVLRNGAWEIASATGTTSTARVFEGVLPAVHNTNQVDAAISWNDSVEHADITHADGDSVIVFDVAGFYAVQCGLEVLDGAGNNRQTWKIELDHLSTTDVVLRTRKIGSAAYIRDDASTYDSGACAGTVNVSVSAGEKVELRTVRMDSQTTAGVNNADPSVSYVEIFRLS